MPPGPSRRKRPEPILVAKRGTGNRLEVRERLVQPSRQKLNGSDARAQATLMMMRRLLGDGNLQDLSQDFGLAQRTVSDRLSKARLDGVPDAAREVFIRELLPASMAVLKEAVDGDDIRLAVQVALKIVDGLKVMEPPSGASPDDGTEFEVWRERIHLKRGGQTGPETGPLPAGILTAEILPPDADGRPSLPDELEPTPAQAAAGEDGIEANLPSGASGDASHNPDPE